MSGDRVRGLRAQGGHCGACAAHAAVVLRLLSLLPCAREALALLGVALAELHEPVPGVLPAAVAVVARGALPPHHPPQRLRRAADRHRAGAARRGGRRGVHPVQVLQHGASLVPERALQQVRAQGLGRLLAADVGARVLQKLEAHDGARAGAVALPHRLPRAARAPRGGRRAAAPHAARRTGAAAAAAAAAGLRAPLLVRLDGQDAHAA